MSGTCTYCGSALDAYDPLYLRDGDGPIGEFCNFACLSAYVDERGLAVGDACEWSPD